MNALVVALQSADHANRDTICLQGQDLKLQVNAYLNQEH